MLQRTLVLLRCEQDTNAQTNAHTIKTFAEWRTNGQANTCIANVGATSRAAAAFCRSRAMAIAMVAAHFLSLLAAAAPQERFRWAEKLPPAAWPTTQHQRQTSEMCASFCLSYTHTSNCLRHYYCCCCCCLCFCTGHSAFSLAAPASLFLCLPFSL